MNDTNIPKIDVLEKRVDNLEGEIHQRLKAIEDTLIDVRLAINQLTLSPKCTAPNKCIELENQIEKVIERTQKIERWQATIIGMGTVLIFLGPIVGPKLSKLIFGS